MTRADPAETTARGGVARAVAFLAARPWLQALLVVVVLVLAELPVAWKYLVTWPQDQWQVDVEVYREAGRSIVYGRPIYLQMTESPQLLPFTYPPFAALLALPMVLLPFQVLGWVWTALQVLATYGGVLIAFRALLRRAGGARWIAGALVTAPVLWTNPVADGVRFGQVNAFLVLACLADLGCRRTPWQRGVLIGLATAVKLTPGVFLVHLLWSRRWRDALTALGVAVGATVAAFLVLPGASITFWTGALSDPARLGPNAGTSNQSIRGVLLRLGPDGTAGTAVWLLCVVVVGVIGFTVARRADAIGDQIAAAGACGLMAVLLSPVAWIHHFAWLVIVMGALVGDGRSRRRALYGAVTIGWFLCRLPWWGVTWRSQGRTEWFGLLMQNADLLGALLALAMLADVVRREGGSPAEAVTPAQTPRQPAVR
ncbi:MAG TPA: glycosyltransferase 87 family protein [Actinomycetales bacterium]|nr:glycosyltransferase 87 family protein [Actinomycetales bacterium]